MVANPRRSAGIRAAESALRTHALRKPEATEHFPWGERAIKVKGKVFLFMSRDADELSLSTKLPGSSAVALLLPFAESTGYGLGKAGWVSARFDASDKPPVELLCDWIDESYQAIAPAKLAAVARGDDAGPTAQRAPIAKKPRTKPTTKHAKTSTKRAKPTVKRAESKPATRRRAAK
jgi:predicted DNA-binding protein (MmcQ/YjbR family)